ncbi:short-chain dehydrogenase [Streptomyces tateyamensis]|uniref:Short-chain dehydrogenase n=1 Tax=Streptomyces tateyamensis TaxID=565073 RepID=A0A2V4NPH0_9ACTN|nr:SDR family oxidoreductase [Streptomyces tateyamensis]PYC77750.1 short-chain dehydrogenase [Streptomyces tateyamensis]
MTKNLGGTTALVTGATSGIGEAAAVRLAELGASVIVHGRSAERGAAVVKEIQSAGGQARFLAADLGDPDQVRRLAEEAGEVDILVNNAGVFKFLPTVEVDDATFSLHIDTNLRAPFLLVKHLAPGMAARGSGAVVNVSTFGASVPVNRGGIYSASKAGLELLTLVWADEFGPSGVRVNAVSVGPTKTPGAAEFGELVQQLGENSFALGRAAEATEIAETIAYLASPAASIVNGAILQAHGGLKAVTLPG